MINEQLEGADEPLETARQLEMAKILNKGTAYKLAKAGLLPFYVVGPKLTGIRFRRSEVLAALRRPLKSQRS